jgi:hypothetical protein
LKHLHHFLEKDLLEEYYLFHLHKLGKMLHLHLILLLDLVVVVLVLQDLNLHHLHLLLK